MSQIEELQSRITAAMERIGKGASALSAMAEAAAEHEANAEADAALTLALDEEKLANAQLQERLKRLKARHAEELAEARAESEAAGADDGAATADMQAEIETLKAELEQLSSEATRSFELEAELQAARARIEAAGDVDALKAELEDAKARLEDTSEADGLRDRVAELEADIARAAEAAEVEALRSDLEGADHGAEAEALRRDLETLRTEYRVQADAMAELDIDTKRLRTSNDQLREAITALREANAAGVGDPSLINKAMLAELEGLRATRAADVTEAGAVLARLEPLLAQAANLPEGEVE